MKGSYVLLICLCERKQITIGKLGTIGFNAGWYAYIGSALNSLPGRINRHLRNNKTFHWHIDYFLQHATIKEVYYKENRKRKECEIATEFSKHCNHITSFGCSDCRCQSHLFNESKKQLLQIIEYFEMIKYSRENT
ncbi:MAG: GIY-YIG nuclease family protein [Thermoplasmatota archaeon]